MLIAVQNRQIVQHGRILVFITCQFERDLIPMNSFFMSVLPGKVVGKLKDIVKIGRIGQHGLFIKILSIFPLQLRNEQIRL